VSARFAVGAGACVLVFLVVVSAAARLAPTPAGPASSSYATQPHGAAAYAELLDREGRRVVRLRRRPADNTSGPGTTLVILDGERLHVDDAFAVGRFVHDGGRLVVAGPQAVRGIEPGIDGDLPEARPAPAGRARPLGSQPETGGVGEVRAPAGGELSGLGDAQPVLGADGAVLASVQTVGRGRIVVLASASPLQNRALADADNAKLALNLAGPTARPVAFLESVHGYAAATGLRALPASAKGALLGLLLAGVAFAWSRWRRLGPVERGEDEELSPPRAAYIDALAATLERAQGGNRRAR
jgi:hypothetical protein